MQKKEVQILVEKYLHNVASKEETEKLFQWYWTESGRGSEWELDRFQSEEQLKSLIYSKIMEQKDSAVDAPKRKFSYSMYGMALATTILIFLCSVLYFHSSEPQESKNIEGKTNSQIESDDIQPGGNKAVLTLADGTKIELDGLEKGLLVNQGGIKVHKNTDGIIEYTFSLQDNHSPELTQKSEQIYNTIETPIGGKYQLNLADGTKVWLNSSSTIRFPIAFTEANREVELKGEAYFEVSKHFGKKFSVRSANQSVEVLGTHFNINAYSDEKSIKTTLLEGEVRVIELNTKDSKLLKPGQQSMVSKSIRVEQIDTQAEIAWKEGYFNFKNAEVQTVMRQLGRWYGVTTRYEGSIPNNHFSGALSTELTLLEVLEVLEKSNIHFRLEGREVIVMP